MPERAKKEKRHFLAWLDTHHVLERQFLFTGFSVIVLASSFIYSNIHNNNVMEQEAMQVSPAGQQVQFSKSTSTVVTLDKMQLSSDQSTAFIPLQVSSFTQISPDANNYKVIVADSSGKNVMKYKVTGSLMIYPSAGYNQMIIILKSDNKITNEPLTIGIENQKQASQYGLDSTGSNATDDNAAAINTGQVDGLMIKVNPGADNIVNSQRTNPDITSLQSVYGNIYGVRNRDKILKNIKGDQTKIKNLLATASGLKQRLSQAGFKLVADPVWTQDTWRPKVAIDSQTGMTQDGLSGSDYYVKSYGSTSTSAESSKRFNQFPDKLSPKAGYSAMSESQSGSGTPYTEWQNLQSVWQQIALTKVDMYVTQQYALYKNQQAINRSPNGSTMSSKVVIQTSPVQE